MLLLAFLVIEPRIMLRPEMFTLLYLSLLLFILDQYFFRQGKSAFPDACHYAGLV